MSASIRDLLYAKERLDEVAGMLGRAPATNEALGVVVEIGIPHDTIMIAGYANGDARLLWNSGGGLFGDLYQFPSIAEAAKELCATAQSALPQLRAESSIPPFPEQDNVRVAVLTRAQRYAAQVPGPEIISPAHPLSATFAAANNLFDRLSQLQQSASEKK